MSEVDLQGLGCSALTIWKSGRQLDEASFSISRLEILEIIVDTMSVLVGNGVGFMINEVSVLVTGIPVALGLKG